MLFNPGRLLGPIDNSTLIIWVVISGLYDSYIMIHKLISPGSIQVILPGFDAELFTHYFDRTSASKVMSHNL